MLRPWPFLVASLLAAGCVSAPKPLGHVDSILATATDPVCQGTLAGLDLRTATIDGLQRGLADGRFTSVDLVNAYIQRIEALDNHGTPPIIASTHDGSRCALRQFSITASKNG